VGIHLTDQDGRAICEARCTLAVIDLTDDLRGGLPATP
jgi:hypothetical protein